MVNIKNRKRHQINVDEKIFCDRIIKRKEKKNQYASWDTTTGFRESYFICGRLKFFFFFLTITALSRFNENLTKKDTEVK